MLTPGLPSTSAVEGMVIETIAIFVIYCWRDLNLTPAQGSRHGAGKEPALAGMDPAMQTAPGIRAFAS